MEEWRDVGGYEDRYRVSSLGQVESVSRTIVNNGMPERRPRPARVLKPQQGLGNQFVFLRDGATTKQALVHRLVLEAFVGPCPAGMEAKHRDGDYTNNTLSNLLWSPVANRATRGVPFNRKRANCPMGRNVLRCSL
jgi:hypothetical protein